MSLQLFVRALAVAAACAFAQPGTAQPTPSVPPDPLDAKASVPAPRYVSAFARFKPWGEDKPVPWRQANDSVNSIGGWRVYAREAQHNDAAQPGGPGGAKKP